MLICNFQNHTQEGNVYFNTMTKCFFFSKLGYKTKEHCKLLINFLWSLIFKITYMWYLLTKARIFEIICILYNSNLFSRYIINRIVFIWILLLTFLLHFLHSPFSYFPFQLHRHSHLPLRNYSKTDVINKTVVKMGGGESEVRTKRGAI